MLLKTCRENKIRINVKKLLREPWMFEDEELIKKIAQVQNGYTSIVKKLGER